MGFNTFLPEGEGYKIELTAEEQAEGNNGPPSNNNNTAAVNNMAVGAPETNISQANTVAKQVAPSMFMAATPAVDATAPSVTSSLPPNPTLVPQPLVNPLVAGQQQPQPGQPIVNAPLGSIPASSILPSGNTFAFTAAGKLPPATVNMNTVPGSQVQQAHAIHYVTKIRNRFANEPETYR